MAELPPAGNAAVLWHSLATDQVLKELGTDEDGLTSQEAAARLQRYEHWLQWQQPSTALAAVGIA
jgi:hypothetical protein